MFVDLIPDAAGWIQDYGLAGLFAFAFLAATIVPISSELALVAALQFGLPEMDVLLWASVGNIAGASTNYLLGIIFSKKIHRKLYNDSAGRRALKYIRKYGGWSMLGSWLPIIGDPLCVAAGIFHISMPYFFFVGMTTRVLRYVLLILVF